MGATFSIRVPAEFIFESGRTFVEVNGQRLDFGKLESLQEVHLAFVGIAQAAIISAASAEVSQPAEQPAGATKGAADVLSAAFHDQANARNAGLDELEKSYKNARAIIEGSNV